MDSALQHHAEGLDSILDDHGQHKSSVQSRPQHLALEIEMNGSDDHDDDEEEDMAPLIHGSVGSPTNRPGWKRKSSYLAKQIAAGMDGDRSWWSCIRGTALQLTALLAFLFVATVIFAPANPNNNNGSSDEDTVDHCKAIFNMSIDELMEGMEAVTLGTKNSAGGYDPSGAFCVPGAVEKGTCRCRSSVAPTPQVWENGMQERWDNTFARNKALVMEVVTGKNGGEDPQEFDVVFYGDSITEHWIGTDLAHTEKRWMKINKVFKDFFDGVDKPLKGLPLGIGGDKCEHVLYRLQNGEMPESLHSKVFWILVGTNDFGAYSSSADTVAAGNIKIAREVLAQRHSATVVLNSILPRSRGRDPDANMYTQPQWPLIERINSWLECYAISTHGVEFFNATDLFLNVTEEGAYQISEYYEDRVHPSAQGSVAWAQGIVEMVHQLTG